jgi:hypothetical protein
MAPAVSALRRPGSRPLRGPESRPHGERREEDRQPDLSWPQADALTRAACQNSGLLGRQTIGIAAIVKNSGLTRQTVYRMKEDPVAAEAALAAWEVAKSKSRQTSGYWALEAFS